MIAANLPAPKHWRAPSLLSSDDGATPLPPTRYHLDHGRQFPGGSSRIFVICAVTLQYRPPVGGGGLPAGQFFADRWLGHHGVPGIASSSFVHGRWLVASTLLGLKPDEAILLIASPRQMRLPIQIAALQTFEEWLKRTDPPQAGCARGQLQGQRLLLS